MIVGAGHGFPAGFRWGCATSAYQNEGDNSNSDWWLWEQGAGHVAGGQRSGKACDWWGDGFTTDLEWMTRLHQNAHRMSVEWSRIEPRDGHWDTSAMDRYRFMLRCMRERGIEPMVTLHHFSNPIWLAEQGGWETPNVAAHFERFVSRTVHDLRDLCDLWIPVNEPTVYAVLGYLQNPDAWRHQSTFPPGRNDLSLARRVLRHMLIGHARAYHAIHSIQPRARVGIAHHMQTLAPSRHRSPLDRGAARLQDRIMNQSLLDAVLRGRIPGSYRRRLRSDVGDTADFLGVNYYSRELVRFDLRAPRTLFGRRMLNPAGEISDRHFSEVYPEGLYHLLRRLQRVGKPIYITENGLPDEDDDRRPAFLVGHLEQVARAMSEGADVRGYYHWTLTDNFEWAEGWNLRFGLIALEPATQKRILRASGRLFGEICRTGRLVRS
jgi:beta-glucosidase